MGLMLQLTRFLRAVIVIAAFLVPSIASAHDGHAHHNSATAESQANQKSVSPSMAQATQQVQGARASAFKADAGADAANCASHCCGGAAGMACCGAMLVEGFSA